MRVVSGSACLSDEELATPVVVGGALAHLETCDACREIWLHAHDRSDAPWTVGRYEVRGTLGAGGLGVVLLGWDPVLQREVAIKFPAARRGLLLREAQALAAIRHRNVVAVHDFGEVDGDVYFTMERVDGVPFDTWWLGAKTKERVRALQGVAAGLGAIHAAGLVHCDIKPSNIVVTRAGEAIIVDLGLATSSADAEALGGTPGYRAPEVERGGAPTPAADIYAFWSVVRQCLATAPMSAMQRSKLLARVGRGTATDPARRFPSMKASAEALDSVFRASRVVVGIVAFCGVAALGLTISIIAGDTGPACDAELAVLPAKQRAAIEKQLADRPQVLARVFALVERERTAGEALLAKTCASDDVAQLRTRSCVRASWRQTLGHVAAIAGGRDVEHSLDELPLGVPVASCEGVTASPPAIAIDATATSRQLHARMFGFAGLPPAPKLQRLAALAGDVEAANNPGLSAAYQLELAETHQRAGTYREALAHAVSAVDIATRNGDDVVLARARLTVYILRDVPDRDSVTRDEEIEAIVARVGSPGMLAMFHNAAGQRAIARGDIERARALLEKSIDMLATLEVAPSMMRGSGEQNLGVALQYSRDLDGAQRHFDRAVEVFAARFGRAHDETLGARLAAASNLTYRGRIEDGARALDQLADELAASQRSRTALGANVAMARCQSAQALRNEPLARCRDALEIARAVFGADSIDSVPPLVAVAQLTMATSVRDAVPLLEQAIAIAEKQAGNPTDLPYARGLYALALKVVGRAKEGAAVAKLAIADLERLGQKELVAALREHYRSL